MFIRSKKAKEVKNIYGMFKFKSDDILAKYCKDKNIIYTRFFK